jgi:hypothetical protein
MSREPSLDERLAPDDFVADFVWAGRAALDTPGVVLISILFWCVPSALILLSTRHPNLVAPLVGCGLTLFAFGWLGAERAFFRARLEGKNVSLRELLAEVPFFMGRFLRLGLRFGLPVGVSLSVALAITRQTLAGDPHAMVTALHLESIVAMLVADVALTFVTPALAYTTESARQALRIGFRMIRQTWPRSGLYVFCPPLALNLLNTIYRTRSVWLTLLTTAALTLVALVAKGATAAFYLRQQARPQ